MLIALDYDGTYTADPMLFDDFIGSAHCRGHRIVTVTARKDTPENRAEIRHAIGDYEWPIVFAYDTPKKLAAIEAGWCPDVWIDDNPQGIGDGTENVATQSVFEIELRHAYEVLTDGNLRMNEFAELIERIETVIGKP